MNFCPKCGDDEAMECNTHKDMIWCPSCDDDIPKNYKKKENAIKK